MLFQQRTQDAIGGEAGVGIATSFSISAMLFQTGIFKKGGFDVWPLRAQKMPKYGGIACTGALAFLLGCCVTTATIGDTKQLSYLSSNKRAIVRGDMPCDQAPAGLL